MSGRKIEIEVVDDRPPASKEVVESARTLLAGLSQGDAELPGTEPLFRGDAKQAVAELIRQARRAQEVFDLVRDDPFPVKKMSATMRALDGVRIIAERLLGPRTHHLKCDPAPYVQVAQGLKTYEIRKFDRDYVVGDYLVLAEFDRQTRQYSGQKVRAKIVAMTPPGNYDMPENIGVLGIELAPE